MRAIELFMGGLEMESELSEEQRLLKDMVHRFGGRCLQTPCSTVE
jgi:hypothetical protein